MMEGGEVERWLPRGLHQRAALQARARDRARADEGRDAQPPDRDLALSRARRPAPAARSATKARPGVARSRRPGSPASRVEPAPARHRRAVGARAPYGKPEHIASALQIMIEGPIGGAAFNNEFGRPNLAGYFRVYEQTVAGVRRGYHKPIMIAGGLGRDRARPDAQDRLPRRHAAGAARRPRHAHRHGRRRGELDGGRRQRRRRSTSTRCSAATPRSSDARRRSSTTAGPSARTTRSSRSTTSARAALATPSPSSSTAPARVRASICARCRSRRAAWRRRRSGATRARSATSSRSRPSRCRCSTRCASASAARSPSSASRPTSRGCGSTTTGDDVASIDMPMEVLLGKPPKMTATSSASRATARRST